MVGAGPVGAFAAYRLARMGIDTILIEALPNCPEDMRASTFHPPSIEMLDALELSEALIADGLKAPVYQYRDRRSGQTIELDMTELSEVTPHPYRLQCEQYKLARLASARLDAHPCGTALFSHRLLAFEQDDTGVTVQVETPMAVEQIRCDYMIGADGANSTVRKWTGIGFNGFTWPESFLTLSTAYPIEQHIKGLANVNYVADATEWCVLLRVPTLWRMLVPAPGGTGIDYLSDAYKSGVFDRLVGDGKAVETYHRTLYRVHQRVAETFRQGRVLLAGDAAHLNNPLGGFGMNSGLHDAWNLTGKLEQILIGGEPADPLLDRFDRQRRTISHEFIQSQTIQNKEAMESTDVDGRSLQESKLRALLDDKEARMRHLLAQGMFTSLRREAEIA